MIIWFTMVFSIFMYLSVCYYILIEKSYKPVYDIEILQNNLFLNINIYTSIYILAAIVFIGTYYNFKRSYSKIVTDTINEEFEDIEAEFKSFKEKYVSSMFVHLALYESIIILGVIVFLLTLDFTTLTILAFISTFGFILVMPNKSKFKYRKEDIYF